MRRIDEDRLKSVYDYIAAYQQSYGQSPSLREIGHHCGISSLSTVSRMVHCLKDRDLIGSTVSGSKTFITIPQNLLPGKNVVAPIVGSCPCGEPMLAVENILSTVSLPVEIFGGGEHFLLYAKGNSMVGRGIFDGDLMVVRKQNNAEVGEVVIARIDGDDATAKVLAKSRSGEYYLKPANNALDENGKRIYKDIRPHGVWEIMGVVDNVIHKPDKECNFA